MYDDPQDSEACPTCKGEGKVACEHSCSECSNGGECKEQDEQTFMHTCATCDGSGYISGSAARAIRAEQNAEAAEQRWYEDRHDRLPAA